MLNQTEKIDTLRLIRCGIGAETYGLDMSWVRSIQRIDRLLIDSEMGTDDTDFVGWLPSNRGDIPVFNLASRLGRPLSSVGVNSRQRVIVLPSPAPFTRGRHEEGLPWALLVDRVSQVIEVPGDRFESLPRLVVNSAKNYFEGVIKMEKSLILFLSPEWLHPDAPSDNQTSSRTKIQHPKLLPRGHKPAKSKIGRIMVFSTAKRKADDRTLTFGLSVTQIPEILRPLPLIPVPMASSFVLGLINWRDRPVPVIDLTTRLGLGYDANLSANGQSRLMIARGNERNALIGFLIQPEVRTLQLPIAHRPTTRTLALDQTLIKGIVDLENETLVIPDIPAILE